MIHLHSKVGTKAWYDEAYEKLRMFVHESKLQRSWIYKAESEYLDNLIKEGLVRIKQQKQNPLLKYKGRHP